MRILLTTLFLILTSCYSQNQGVGDEPQLWHRLGLPYSSLNLPSYHKSTDGGFDFDTSFHSDSFNAPTRILGNIYLSDTFHYLLAEQKSNDDGTVGPLITVFSYYFGQRADSMVLNLTVQWEGLYTKRFKIDETGSIYIITVNAGYDLESTQAEAVLLTDTTEEYFKLASNGMFSRLVSESQLISPTSNHSKNKFWKGRYKIATTGISWSDNSLVSLRYFVSIDKDSTLILSIGSNSTSDYKCEGIYEYWIVGDTLYTWGKCDSELKSNFKMLNIGQLFYISSERFSDSNWQLLTKTE